MHCPSSIRESSKWLQWSFFNWASSGFED
jgi:hypothetical protein